MSMSKCMPIYPRFNTLSREEEYELAVKAKNGNARARDTLILSNIPFALKYSREFSGYKIDAADLSQIAMIGLIEAVDKFDATKGFRVITYAKWWIRKEIEEAANKANKNRACPFSKMASDDPDFDEESFLSSLVDGSENQVEEDCINNEKTKCLRKAVANLPEKESEIINRHFGLTYKEPQSLNEIGESYGLSKARIHQLEKSAFGTLRKELEYLCA